MSRKNLLFTFIAMYASLGLVVLLLEWYTSTNGPLLDAREVPTMTYVFSIVVALTTIVSAFYAIRQRNVNPLIRLSMLNTAALLAVMDYYLFYDTNMLACLPILAVASLFILLKREE